MKKIYFKFKSMFMLLPLLFIVNTMEAQFCMTATQTVGILPSTTSQTTSAYSTGAICFTFNATSGCNYTFATCNLSSSDTYLRLYSGIGVTFVVGDDDGCAPQSYLTWACTSTGVYSILMNDYFCSGLSGSTAMSYVTDCAGTLCSGAPNGGTAAISTTVGCPNLNFNLSASGLTSASGLSYQWYISSSSTGPWTAIASATNANAATNATATSYFQLVTTCTASSQSATSSVVSYSVVNPGPCICNNYGASAASFTGDEDIFLVRVGTLNNTSNCTTPATGPGSALSLYANYAGVLAAPDLCRGSAAAYTVNVGTCSSTWYGMSTSIFIDFNQNGSFADPGELVMSNNTFSTFISSAYTATYTGNITIPATASLGITRMRVISKEQSALITTATGVSNYGETEDYCVNIVAGPQISASNGSVCPGQPFVVTPSGAVTYTYHTATGTISTGTSATVNPIVNTSYSVSGTGTNGCVTASNSALAGTFAVSLLQSPTLTAVSTPTAYCNGGSAVLSVSGANTYTWTTPSSNSTTLSVNPTVTTVYTVAGTGTNICNGVVAVTVVVNPIPVITINSGTMCSGYNFTLNPGGASTYTILNNSGTVTSVVSPSASANYSVLGTSVAGCLSNPLAAPVSTVFVVPSPTISASSGTVCIGSSFSLSPSGSNNTYTVNGVPLGTNVVGAFSPSVNTVYTISGTNSNGCVSFTPAIAGVSVVPVPTLTAITNSNAICIGQASANLTASGANTYTWSNGVSASSVAVSPTNTTVYTVIGTSTLLCNNSATVAVNVLMLPPVTAQVSQNFICVGGNATLTAGGANTYSWSNNTTSAVTVVSPSVNATYTTIGTDLNGCYNTATVAVTVNTLVMTVVPTSTSVCLGSSVTFTASGATTYSWNGTFGFNTYLATPTTATAYTVTAIDPNNCPQSKVVLASVYQLPTVSTSITNTLICIGESATISATGANTYSWSNGAATSSIVVSPTIDITYMYSVVGTDTNNCTASNSQTLAVSRCVGLEKVENDATLFSVYPNPSNGNYTVEMTNSTIKEIEVVDLTGRVIYKETSTNNKLHVNLSTYPSGVYYLKVKANNSIQTTKLIKE